MNQTTVKTIHIYLNITDRCILFHKLNQQLQEFLKFKKSLRIPSRLIIFLDTWSIKIITSSGTLDTYIDDIFTANGISQKPNDCLTFQLLS